MRVYWNAILVSSKYYTALPILNKQRFAPFFWSESSNKRETNILAVVRIPFERDAFRLNPFGTFRETTFKQARNSSLGTLC